MILRIEDLQDCCKTILAAVDNSSGNDIKKLTETLEISVQDKYVIISVTNREYFVSVKLFAGDCEPFKATVNAKLFLKLVSQITTDTIELSLDENNLNVKGNGKYKLPLIFDGESMLELPEINIQNATSQFTIPTSTLHGIITYNSRELKKGNITRDIQNFYYLDNQGALTFTNGACVNTFSLDKPIKVLLTDKVVKLFKLFKGDKDSVVDFTLGQDALSEKLVQTKVRFANDSICITAIIGCDDTYLNAFPASRIREMANKDFPYRCVINKEELQRTVGRLMLFSESGVSVVFNTFDFSADGVTIWDADHNNSEFLNFENHVDGLDEGFSCRFDLTDLKLTLDTTHESYINLKFGDTQAAVIEMKNISTVLPISAV